MRSKLVGRLLSFTLSATVALTSGIPSLAYDSSGGDLPEEELEILDLDEEIEDEDLGSDFDVLEEEDEFLDEIDVEEEAEFLGNSYTITYYNTKADADAGTNAISTKTNAEDDDKIVADDLISIPTTVPDHCVAVDTSWHNAVDNAAIAIGDTLTASIKVYAFRPITVTVTAYEAKFFDASGDPVTEEQPSFSGLSTSGVDWDASFNFGTQPTVGGYTASGWYYDAACTATTAQAHINAATDDVTFTKLYAKYTETVVPAATSLAIFNQAGIASKTFTAPAIEYASATAGPFVFAAADTINSGTSYSEYSNVTWALYKEIDDTLGTESARTAEANLIAVTSGDLDQYGLAYTVVTTGGVSQFKITNSGIKKKPAGKYVLIASDQHASATTANKRVVKEFEFNYTGPEEAAHTNTITITPSPVAFDTVKMGYSVVGDNEVVSTDGSYVRAANVTLSTAIVGAYGIDDFTYEWDGPDKDAFDAEIIDDGNGLWNSRNRVITIKPKAGLTNKGDKATTVDGITASTEGKYEANLHIKSSTFDNDIKVPVSFTVENNLAFSSVIAHGGADATEGWFDITDVTGFLNPAAWGSYKTANSSTQPGAGDTPTTDTSKDGSKRYWIRSYNLGTFKIGERFDDVVITATGGAGKIKFNEYESANLGASTNILKDGLNGVKTETNDEATYVVTGPLTAGAGLIGNTYSFILQAEDSIDTIGNLSEAAYFSYTVAQSNAALEIDGNEFVVGSTSATANVTTGYTWYIVGGYSEAEAQKQIIFTNKSDNAIAITAAMADAAGTDGGTTALTTYNEVTVSPATVPAGGSAVITIKPKTGNTSNAASNTAYVRIKSTSFSDTAIKVAFDATTTGLAITQPATDGTIKAAELGKEYRYEFGVTKASTFKTVTWSLNDFGVSGSFVGTSKAATELAKYGLSFNESTGVLSGTPTKLGTINVKVTATSGSTTTAVRQANITIGASADAFTFSYNGNEVDNVDKFLEIGEVKQDEIGNLAVKATLTNSTAVDLKGVRLAVSSVDSATAGDNASYASIVFSENDALNTAMANAFDLDAGDSIDFTIKVNAANVNSVGPHYVILKASDRNGVSGTDYPATYTANLAVAKEMRATFKVVVAPVVETSFATGFTTGTEVTAAAGQKYVVKYNGVTKTSDYTFAWTTGSVPGLELSEDGKITGTPTQAGKYDVTVTATNKKDSSIVGTLKHTITVAGASAVTMSLVFTGNPAITDKKTVLLPGMVVGGETGDKATVNMSIAAASAAAKNLKITVEDSEDDRTAAEAADIIKNPGNPYAGSSSYIGVSKESWGTIASGANQSFTIVSKGSPAAGIYKVKITVSADNASSITFYAVMAVVDKFAITQSDVINTKIGNNFTTKPIEIGTTGASDTQKITWKEAGTKVDGKTEYYVSIGTGATAGNAATTNATTNLTMRDGSANEIGTDVSGTTTVSWDKTIITNQLYTAGTMDVTLKAEVPATAYNAAATMKSDKIIKRSASIAGGGIVNATEPNLYPKQEADPMTFTIISTKSDKFKISNVTTTSTIGKIVGRKNGDQYVTWEGFDYTPTIAGYNKSQKEVSIVVTNSIFATTTPKAVAKASLSEDSKFEITSSKSLEVNSNGGTSAFKVTPKSGLTKGTYTDTLVISGDTFESVEFALSFTVEDNTYKVSVDNGESDADNLVVYVEDNEVKGVTIKPESFVASTAATAKVLTITNSGNSTINNVSAYEVKADGTKYPTGSADTMINVNTLSKVMNAEGTQSLRITPKKTSAGKYNTYVDLHFEEGTGATAVEHDVIIPVEYVVFGADVDTLSVSPAETTNLSLTEGYTSESGAVEFVLTNNGTSDSDTIEGIIITPTGTPAVTVKPAIPSTGITLKPGESATYSVVPAKGSPEGSYQATVTVSGTNLKAPITRTIKYTVEASTMFTTDVYTATDTRTDIAGGYATRLYNSLIGLMKASSTTPAITASALTAASTSQAVTVNFGTSVGNVVVTFTGTTDSTAAASGLMKTVTSATISSSINLASKSITLSDKAISEAKKLLGNSGAGTAADPYDAKYFSIINFKFFRKVVFGVATTQTSQAAVDALNGVPEAGKTLYAENKADIENDNVVVQYYMTIKKNDRAYGSITAYVPYGASLGSVFEGGKLPTATEDNKVMSRWLVTGGNDYNADSEIIEDIPSLTAAFHTHSYAVSTVSDEKYVKWVWTKDEKGNLSAELHLFCTDKNCPDHDGSELVFTKTKSGVVTFTYGTGTKTEATCEHGEGNTFTVSAAVLGTAIGGSSPANDQTYTSEYVEDETGEPLGHKYDLANPAKVVWDDANKDKKIDVDELTITRVCTRDESHVATLKVVSVDRDEASSKLPTCTQPGYDVFAITYEEINEKGEPAGNATVLYNKGEKFTVPATGHSEELEEIVEGFDEDTLKATVTLKCKNENCDATDHIVFGPVEVQFAEQADGTFAAEVTLTDGTKKTISYVNHVHVWTPTWKWSAVEGDLEKKVVELTLTCNVGTKAHAKTFSDTITATKNGLVWTWTASFEYDGKPYTDDQTEVRDEETGEEIEVEDISGGKGIVITLYRDEYNYTGSPIKPTDFSVLDLERDNDYYLNPGTEYSVSYKNNTKVGEAEIIIKGKGNYAGKATSAKFKIVNPYPDDAEAPVVKGATLKLPKATYTFNNEEQFPATVEFGLKGQTAKTYTFDGGSYVDSEGNPLPAAWTCENNRNAGTATFAVLGVKDSKGQPTAVKKTFKIQAATLDTTNFKVLVGSQEKDFEIEWFAKGATPWVDIVWANGDNEFGLWSGKDFTVSYKDNKKAGTASVSIKGKGNFKGALKNVATFKINALDLGETWLQAVTVKAGNKGKQVKVTVVDHHDNIIPASKYTVSVTDASTGADLTNTKLTAGMEILVKAVAKDSTAVAGETDERPVTIAADFSKASVKVASSFYKEYTGQAIELTDEDMKNITVTIKVGKEKKTLVYGEDFFIAGTADNVNKGTMTVTIVGNAEADTERGIPAFSGSKTFKVKIKARQLPLK